ncbi:MAG: bifunctional lysine ketoglutarate reductase /saccharopine dehydrogenase family protein [Calditrichaceae bacterium]
MNNRIGIRREDIDQTEKRAPLSPDHVKELVNGTSLDIIITPSKRRIFTNNQYKDAGAILNDDLSDCNVIFGVKEVPADELSENKAYCFFSHTIKGQSYNMPLLKRMLELKNTLIDYEKVTDEMGRRIIFFGRYAGIVGAINTLWIYGQRLLAEGIENPFALIKQANKYNSLDEAKSDIHLLADTIRKKGLPQEILPVVIAVTGSGQVSQGAQEIFDLLPAALISAPELLVTDHSILRKNGITTVIIDVDAFTKPVNPDNTFDFNEYINNPEKYRGDFEKYIPAISMLVNGIYWEKKYPRLVTKKSLKMLFEDVKNPMLRVISDITCDIDGSIECNVKTTTSDNPVYVYEPLTGNIFDGFQGNGPVILAVDKLPSELPGESTSGFGDSLLPFIPKLASADFDVPFEKLDIPPEFKRAVIAHKGNLTPDYQYLRPFLDKI